MGCSYTFHTEFLEKPKHNVLSYDRVPKNNMVLLMVSINGEYHPEIVYKWAELLGIDAVPVLFRGVFQRPLEINKVLDRSSYLGGVFIEGVVVKNYKRQILMGDYYVPFVAAKLVSQEFRELHTGKTEKTGSNWDDYKDTFRSEARWRKALIHLREAGEIVNDTADIGRLMLSVSADVEAEEAENIKAWLYKQYRKEILKNATRGLPEWYKQQLVNTAFATV